MPFTRYWIAFSVLIMPGLASASPGSCYGFFTSLYDEQASEAIDPESPGSRVALETLRDQYEDNRPALEHLHQEQESTRFEDEASRGREMARGFLPKLENPTAETRQRLQQSRRYCQGLLKDARQQQRNDTFTAAMGAIAEGSAYGGDDCPAVDPAEVLTDRWHALLGTRVYRLDLSATPDGLDADLDLNHDGQFHDLDRLSGKATGDQLAMSNANDQRQLRLQFTRNSECEPMLAGDMYWNNGSDNARIVFRLTD